MKKLSVKFLTVVALVSFAAYSCIDDKFDSPPINELPIGTVITIEKLRELCPPGNAFTFVGDSSLYAVVTMDEKSGNIYKNAFVQDNTGAVNLRFQSSSALYEGDSIRIYLKGAKLSWYNNLFQVDSLHADSSVIKQATQRYKHPEIATISEINLDKSYFQSRLVKIENVQISDGDLNKTWANAAALQYGELYITDTLGNRMMIRTSGFAKFANQYVPQGFGSITAIVGLYNQTVQLYIRRASEVEMDNPRWVDQSIDPPVPPTGSGTLEDPYNVSAAISNTGSAKWVTGYIVGVLETVNYPEVYENYTPPFTTDSNVLIADSENETNLSRCLPVQLPFGDVRTAINLVNNPTNHNKLVKLKGDLSAYFNQPGLKDASDYRIDGNDDDDDDVVDAVTSISENFQSYTNYEEISKNGWNTIAVSGTRKWICREFSGNKYAQATAYNSNEASNEMWLITPPINFDEIAEPELTFVSAQEYYTHSGFSLLYSTDYNGTNLQTATWQTLSATLAGSGDANHAWVNSGVVNIPVSSGIGYIAWKYVGSGTGGQTGTFRIDDVELYDATKK